MTRKTGPKPASDELAAGLRLQAAVRWIPIGLINQFKLAAKGFARRMVPGVALGIVAQAGPDAVDGRTLVSSLARSHGYED